MTDMLISLYPWAKALHIVAVISWMAGLLYLPRLFVNHVEKAHSVPEVDAIFQSMETKLLKVIMTPAMIATWVFGMIMVFTPGVVDWSWAWPWAKAIAVVIMTGFHMWLAHARKILASGENRLTGRQLRLLNEVPTVLMVVIVFSVVLKY